MVRRKEEEGQGLQKYCFIVTFSVCMWDFCLFQEMVSTFDHNRRLA